MRARRWAAERGSGGEPSGGAYGGAYGGAFGGSSGDTRASATKGTVNVEAEADGVPTADISSGAAAASQTTEPRRDQVLLAGTRT